LARSSRVSKRQLIALHDAFRAPSCFQLAKVHEIAQHSRDVGCVRNAALLDEVDADVIYVERPSPGSSPLEDLRGDIPGLRLPRIALARDYFGVSA
jgi:hypothetical protein